MCSHQTIKFSPELASLLGISPEQNPYTTKQNAYVGGGFRGGYK